MPTLDELRSSNVVTATPAADDFIPFFDVSELGNASVKKSTSSDLVSGGGGVLSRPANITGASAVANVVSISQTDYDALASTDAATLYVITA